ncbi:MAG: hypothetical protein IPH75_13540 [bacterium]|nr:hypothetical protein [bacterium]
MTRTLLILLCLCSSALSQTTIYHSSRSNEKEPISASFRLSDLAQPSLTNVSFQMSLGSSATQQFRPILSLQDSSTAILQLILADTLRDYSLKECRIDDRPGLWFYSGDSLRHLFYIRPDASLEWEIILDSPTTVRQFTFPIKLENLIAYYQPELTATEKAEGYHRPDSIVGSYAIYRRSGGKLLHITRPRAFDADGNAIWCDLKIDSLLTITIPEHFLATATFPIRIDPSFGYSTAGASSLAAASIRCYGNRNSNYRYTAGPNQRVDSFRVHLRTLTGNNDTVDVALYSWNGGIQSRLDTAVWVFTASATASWVSSAQVAQFLTNGTTYTLAINHHEGTPRISYDVGYSGDHGYDTVDDLPVTWTEDGTGTYLISMQAWYSTIATTNTPTRRRRL